MRIALVVTLLLFSAHCKAGMNICDLLDKTNAGELVYKGNLLDRNKRTISITEWRGSITILYFYITWSPDCITDIAHLNLISKLIDEQEEKKNFTIVPTIVTGRLKDIDGVITGADSFYKVRKIDALDRYFDVNSELYSTINQTYSELPFVVIIDASGREIGRASGPFMSQLPKTSQLIKDLKACIG